MLVCIEVEKVRLHWVDSMSCCVIKCSNSYASGLVGTKFLSFQLAVVLWGSDNGGSMPHYARNSIF